MNIVLRRVHRIRICGDGHVAIVFKEGLAETMLQCKDPGREGCTLVCPFAHTGAGTSRGGVSLFVNCVSEVRCTFEASEYEDEFIG